MTELNSPKGSGGRKTMETYKSKSVNGKIVRRTGRKRKEKKMSGACGAFWWKHQGAVWNVARSRETRWRVRRTTSGWTTAKG